MLLQSELTETEELKVVQPLAYFLRRRMEVESRSRRWMKLKERLGCCGVTWGLIRMGISVQDDDGDDDRNGRGLDAPLQGRRDPGWVSLAMALEAERELRAVEEQVVMGKGAMPLRASLMRLMEVAEGGADEEVEVEGGKGCCVCMARRKGAAFIPCGHTFCRPCAREVWVGRGSCPLCNRKILEILHIF